MPVTVRVATHDARPARDELNKDAESATLSQALLSKLAGHNLKDIGPILVTRSGQQTSLPDHELRSGCPYVEKNGLIHAAWDAYSGHHNLVLRPEDVWFAILIQFSFYVNAHAESLRESFVSHQGEKGLVLKDPGQPDMARMCRDMTELIIHDIKDAKLRQWILPSFTTTTDTDKTVASAIMMGTLQGYYEYVFDACLCGIPNVTLLGELSDWKEIRRRLEKLQEYGEEPSHFCRLLQPILDNMIATFTEEPGDAGVTDFWSRIIDWHNDSGSDSLTGWMVAFCYWDEDGKCLYNSSRGFHSNELFGITYHTLSFKSVPAAFISVPITYTGPDDDVIPAKMLAGFVGYQALPTLNHTEKSSVGEQNVANPPEQGQSPSWDTIQPVTAWWMFKVENGLGDDRLTGKDYLRGKFQGEWSGQALVGHSDHRNNTVQVERASLDDL